MPNKMSDAEYGKHIREQSRKYWLRYKAVQGLKDQKYKAAKLPEPTEVEIQAEMKRTK